MTLSSSSIERDLKDILEGDVLCDDASKNAYSTAACMYQIRPVAVVLPRTIDDVVNLVRYAALNRIPLIPRGGGSSMAGQAVGFGIVIDCATYLNKIKAIDNDNNSVTVEPGVVLADLNKVLASKGKFFPPDPASGSQCVIGGMISTNASGAHGIRYGATKDYVLSLSVVLASGNLIEVHADGVDGGKPRASSSQVSAVSRDLEPLSRKLLEHKSLISSRFPKVKKNSSGYNLVDAVRTDPIDLTKLFTGSEGTLGIIVGAKLKTLDCPKARTAGWAYFRDYERMTEAIRAASEMNPSAAEMLDKTLLDVAKEKSPVVARFTHPEAASLVLFEFEGDCQDITDGQMDDLRKLLSERLHFAFEFRVSPGQVEDIWEVRREAARTLETVRGGLSRASFIEDVTVPLDALSGYLKRLRSILDTHGITYSLYGHAGVGNIHCEPFLDLRRAEHRALLDTVSEEVFDEAISLGGTLSGEHGDGFVRTPFLERLYGKEVYELFRRVKEHFDPRGILNPGKIVGPQGATIAHDLKVS